MFRKGMRVRATESLLQQIHRYAGEARSAGTVATTSRTPHLVCVKWDDLKTPETLHVDFVEPLLDSDADNITTAAVAEKEG